MNIKKVKSPITGREYEIRKLPPIFLSQIIKNPSGSEDWQQIASFIKAAVVNPKLASEEDILQLGEDADFLLLEAASFNKPSEEYKSLFQLQKPPQNSGGGG